MKRPPWKKIEEDRARPCTRVFCPLSSYVSLSCLPFRSFSFFLADWDVNPPPFNLSAYNLPTYCIYLPTKLLILQKEEGRQFVGPGDAYLTQHLHLWYLRNVLSSFILVRLFNRSVNDNRVSRCAHFYCRNSTITREYLNVILWHQTSMRMQKRLNLSFLK